MTTGWWVVADVALYLAAIVAFFTGYGWVALVCVILALVLTFILTGVNDDLSWYMLFDSITDLFD